MRLFLPILFLSLLALVVELPKQEVYMDNSGWVYITIRDLSTLVVDDAGNWECKSSMTRISQEEYLRLICEQAPIGDKLRLLSRLSRHWARQDKPVWEAVGITEEQWKDWLLTGELRTQEELDALKPPAADAQAKQIAEAMALIASIKYYLSPNGVWHTTKDCIDCVNAIEVNPFDVMKIPNAKACDKCVK